MEKFTEVFKFNYCPLVYSDGDNDDMLNISRNILIVYRENKTGKHFFYTECDPGLFYDYRWYKCSRADMEINDSNILHFYTQSGKHHAFDLVLDEYADNIRKYLNSIE